MISVHPIIKECSASIDEYPEITQLPCIITHEINSWGSLELFHWMSFDTEFKLFIEGEEYNIFYS